MANIYNEFFQVLKSYLIAIGVDVESKNSGMEGCSFHEVSNYEESKRMKLPLAYKEFLLSMGKMMLFEFMNAEDMSFEDLDYIEEFGMQVFKENNINLERPFLVISERRNEYITFLYLDEGDNPPTWVFSEYWKDSETNLQVRTDCFTDLIMSFTKSTLNILPLTFNFVSAENEMEREQQFNARHEKYENGLKWIYEAIKKQQTENELTLELNSLFKDYIEYYLEIKEVPERVAEDPTSPKLDNESLEKEKELALLKYEQLKREAEKRNLSNKVEKGSFLLALFKKMVGK